MSEYVHKQVGVWLFVTCGTKHGKLVRLTFLSMGLAGGKVDLKHLNIVCDYDKIVPIIKLLGKRAKWPQNFELFKVMDRKGEMHIGTCMNVFVFVFFFVRNMLWPVF